MHVRHKINRSPTGASTFRAHWVIGLVAIGLVVQALVFHPQVVAQIAGTGRGKNFVAPVTDADGRKTVIRGEEARPQGNGVVALTKLKAEMYRGNEKDLIVQSPKCLYDTKANVASSEGSLSIQAVDGRFSIDGEGFQWQVGDSRLSSKLDLSNRVHSLVRKKLITLRAEGGQTNAAPPRTSLAKSGAPSAPVLAPSTNEFIEITSDTFEFRAELAIYRGHVRAHETEGDLVCSVLTVRFQSESGAVDRIDAEQEVVLNQGPMRAAADKATYTSATNSELVEFVGHGTWKDGQRQGKGDRLLFDRQKHFLRAETNAYLSLPRTAFGESGLLSLTTKPAHPAVADTNAVVEVFSDIMTIQLPPTNGPVQRIVAERNVMISDEQQNGRALANKAVFEEATGLLELTGSPMLESEGRLITGQTLLLDRTNRVLTAKPDAYLKFPLQGLGQLGVLSKMASNLPTNTVPATNQFIEVWAREFEYYTNKLVFRDHVRANSLQGDVAQGKLTCDSTLTIMYGDQIQSLTAEKNVELEQYALKGAPVPVSRRVNCQRLQADFSAEGRLTVAVAEFGVKADQEEIHPDLPQPTLSSLSSETVTAYFSALTNRLERMIADKDVVFAQDQRVARAAKAVYTETNGFLEMTGQPTATMPEGRIVEAEKLIWDRVRERFMAKGKFKSEWKRPPARTNDVAKPTAQVP